MFVTGISAIWAWNPQNEEKESPAACCKEESTEFGKMEMVTSIFVPILRKTIPRRFVSIRNSDLQIQENVSLLRILCLEKMKRHTEWIYNKTQCREGISGWKPPAGYPFAMEGNLITMGESVRTARKSRKMSNFRGLEQILKKTQKKWKKVLTKVLLSDNIYLADAVKTKQQNKKSFKKVLTKQKRFDIIFIADAKATAKNLDNWTVKQPWKFKYILSFQNQQDWFLKILLKFSLNVSYRRNTSKRTHIYFKYEVLNWTD